MNNKIKKAALLIGDVVFLYLALLITILARYGFSKLGLAWSNHIPKFIIIFSIWIFVLYLSGFYNLNLKAGSRKFFKSLGSAEVLSGFLSIIFFYLATSSNITPKTNLLIFFTVFSLLFVFWRRFISFLFNSLSKENIAIVGINHKQENILEEIRKNPGYGCQVVLVIKDSSEINSLAQKIKEKNIKTVVICDDFGNSKELNEALFSCLNLNINISTYPDFYEALSGKIPVEEIGSDWFLENIKEGNKNYFNIIKSLVDFSLAAFIFLISLPFWPLISLAIKIESRGDALFKQKRLGKHEKEFLILKFRTMRENGNNKEMTTLGDKRITKLGNFLRKTRLDEIPQVINVLKGEMSFIGPRPERPEYVSELEKVVPFYKTRLLVTPGLSGWDQVSGEYHSPSAEDTLKKLQNDLFYIKNRSLYLDLTITIKTIAAVLGREGR